MDIELTNVPSVDATSHFDVCTIGGIFTSLSANTTNMAKLVSEDVWTNVDTGEQTHSTPIASTTKKGLVELATPTEATAGTDTERATTPEGVKAAIAAIPDASETQKGVIALADSGEVDEGTILDKAVSPGHLKHTQEILPYSTRIYFLDQTVHAIGAHVLEVFRLNGPDTSHGHLNITGPLLLPIHNPPFYIFFLITDYDVSLGTHSNKHLYKTINPNRGQWYDLYTFTRGSVARIKFTPTPAGVQIEMTNVPSVDATSQIDVCTIGGIFTSFSANATNIAKLVSEDVWTNSDTGQVLGTGASLPISSTTTKGIIELATTIEATTGTDTSRATTPEGVKAAISAIPAVPDATEDQKGVIQLATSYDILDGLGADTVVNPKDLKYTQDLLPYPTRVYYLDPNVGFTGSRQLAIFRLNGPNTNYDSLHMHGELFFPVYNHPFYVFFLITDYPVSTGRHSNKRLYRPINPAVDTWDDLYTFARGSVARIKFTADTTVLIEMTNVPSVDAQSNIDVCSIVGIFTSISTNVTNIARLISEDTWTEAT